MGNTEQLTIEMEPYRLSVLAVTKTHLAGEDEIVPDECRSTRWCFLGLGENMEEL